MAMRGGMRIGVDGACWSNRRGYGRFTRCLLEALLRSETRHEFVLFVDAQTYERCTFPAGAECIVVRTSQSPSEAASASGRRSLADLWKMARAVAALPLDAFFFPSVYTYFPVLNRATVVLGVHDVIAEDYPDLIFPDPRSRLLWNAKGWAAHRQAHHVLTVSTHAREGILRHFGHPPERVWVVDEAPDPVFRPLAPAALDLGLLARFGLAPGDRYFLYLGGINPHKNLGQLVHSLAEICASPAGAPVSLVIVGDIQSDGFTPGLVDLKEKIRALGLEGAVRFTGFLPDSEVVHLLNAALALVLPSFAEGFGLPAVEGAACGIPVVATRNSPLPELLAGGGHFVDPARPEELTRALAHLATDEPARREFARTALERVGTLNWDRSARQMQVLLDAVEKQGR